MSAEDPARTRKLLRQVAMVPLLVIVTAGPLGALIGHRVVSRRLETSSA